jgi:MFS family permease
VVFVIIETRVDDPMFHISLFSKRAFSFGMIAALLASIGRGGLMFMVIIWLQGIWLPLHGYSLEQTPFWAAIFMLPLTGGFLVGGPLSGYLSDHLGQRLFATAGMLLAALSFGLLIFLPADFDYPPFAALLFVNGLSMGMFIAPNTALGRSYILRVLREEQRQGVVDEAFHIVLGRQSGRLRPVVPDQRLSEGAIELMGVVRVRLGRIARFKYRGHGCS